MKRLALGIGIGILGASVVFVPLLKSQQKDKYEFGRHQGRIDGLLEASNAIEKEFGKYTENGNYSQVFSAKGGEVVAIEVNNVKTIRVIY